MQLRPQVRHCLQEGDIGSLEQAIFRQVFMFGHSGSTYRQREKIRASPPREASFQPREHQIVMTVSARLVVMRRGYPKW
jgi:hypothetical protein